MTQPELKSKLTGPVRQKNTFIHILLVRQAASNGVNWEQTMCEDGPDALEQLSFLISATIDTIDNPDGSDTVFQCQGLYMGHKSPCFPGSRCCFVEGRAVIHEFPFVVVYGFHLLGIGVSASS